MLNRAKVNGWLYFSGPRDDVEALCAAADLPKRFVRPLRPGPNGETRAYVRIRGRYKRAVKKYLYHA
ncbi:MAG TPA: hypothetical protein VMW93_03460 [bacterium]|nr:hypothetical protein [bacterium]